MRRVDDAEDVFAADKTETGVSGLQVVDCLTHVAFGAEDEGGDSVFGVFDFFELDDLHDASDDFFVC